MTLATFNEIHLNDEIRFGSLIGLIEEKDAAGVIIRIKGRNTTRGLYAAEFDAARFELISKPEKKGK